mgnify:FL=1
MLARRPHHLHLMAFHILVLCIQLMPIMVCSLYLQPIDTIVSILVLFLPCLYSIIVFALFRFLNGEPLCLITMIRLCNPEYTCPPYLGPILWVKTKGATYGATRHGVQQLVSGTSFGEQVLTPSLDTTLIGKPKLDLS